MVISNFMFQESQANAEHRTFSVSATQFAVTKSFFSSAKVFCKISALQVARKFKEIIYGGVHFYSFQPNYALKCTPPYRMFLDLTLFHIFCPLELSLAQGVTKIPVRVRVALVLRESMACQSMYEKDFYGTMQNGLCTNHQLLCLLPFVCQSLLMV